MTIQTELRELTHRHDIGGFLTRRGLDGRFVEVGTLHGGHAQEILNRWPGHLFCVDPWKNQPDAVYFDGANKLNMDQVWQHVRGTIGANPRCTLMRMMSLNAVGKFEDRELDGVYLDGNHAVDAVRADIAAWWPKVKIGGLFCGHDFNMRYDADTNSDALTAAMELYEALDIRPHVTWCTSWYVLKTAEADARFRESNEKRILPRQVYTDNAWLSSPVVVLPVARCDFHLGAKWLAWAARLAGGSRADYRLVVVASPDLGIANVQELLVLAKAIDGGARVETADIVEKGYFGSANQMIKWALEYCEREFRGVPVLWCEADSVPMRSTWVQEIAAEYLGSNRPFMGDIIRESDVPHLTGNAVYHPEWRTLAPSIAALNGEACGWDTLCAHDIVPRAHVAKTIQQVWRPRRFSGPGDVHDLIRPTTALFHQCKDGSLIDVLCAMSGQATIPLQPAIAESTYEREKYRYSGEGPKGHIHNPPGARPAVRTTILIVTFARDMDFLRYCLASIEKFCTGFHEVVLAVPSHERGRYEWVPARVRVGYFDEIPGKGMLCHEREILRADEWCPEASHILHVDADVCFWDKTTPADFFREGRALNVCELYAKIRNPNRHLWKRAVEDMIGVSPHADFMVRHPQMHLREVYAKAREMIQKRTGREWDKWVVSGRNEYPQQIAEFPCLGTVAFRHFNQQYHFEEYDKAKDANECGQPSMDAWQFIYRRGRDKVVECWSHGGIERYRDLLDSVLAGKAPEFVVK